MASLRKFLATRSATTVAFCALVLATGLASLVAVPPAAHAAIAQCNSNWNFLFDGFYSDPSPQTGIEGVSANMRVEDATLCSINSVASENLTASWDMIKYAGGYAQVGVWRHTNTGSEPVYFYAFTADGTQGVPMGESWHTGVPVGSTHRFWVQWVTNGCPSGLLACFAFNIDTTRIAVSTFDPDSAWGDPSNPATAWDMQFMGETHNTSTDIMGSNAGGVATVWSSAQAQDWNTDQYRSFTCNLTDREDSNRYGLNYPSNQGCGTWSTYTYSLR